MGEFINFLGNNLADFWTYTGFANATVGHIVMILIGLFFIYLAVAKEFEPMLLIPIGFGILIGNIPFNMEAGLKVGIYEEGSVLNILYQGVTSGWYPPLIFLGIGAMTDFSALISNPKLMLIGAAAQFGIFGAYMIALAMGFDPMQAGAIGIIGGADGPTAIFLSSKLAPNLMGAIAVSAYSYMALVPVIQPPIMRLLTTKHERLIRMKPPRAVSHTEKVMFPIIGLLLTCFLVPSGLPLLGMLFFGNLLKESGVTRRLAETARGPLIDTITILLGLTVGASTQASEFLTLDSILIFALGALSFIIATASGVIFVKIFNLVLGKDNKINPLIGNAGVSAVPDSEKGYIYNNRNTFTEWYDGRDVPQEYRERQTQCVSEICARHSQYSLDTPRRKTQSEHQSVESVHSPHYLCERKNRKYGQDLESNLRRQGMDRRKRKSQ